jgi:hypothetical protein
MIPAGGQKPCKRETHTQKGINNKTDLEPVEAHPRFHPKLHCKEKQKIYNCEASQTFLPKKQKTTHVKTQAKVKVFKNKISTKWSQENE